MTLISVLQDFAFASVFILIGMIIREKVKFLQRIFLSASLIGGAVALILGPQVLGIIDIPESLTQWSTPLSNIIMTACIFGIPVGFKKLRGILDFSFISLFTYSMQLAVGLGVGLLITGVWKDLYEGWGVTALFSFHGGAPLAGPVGSGFESYGINNMGDLVNIMSIIGLLTAVILGTYLANIGVRKGEASYTDKVSNLPDSFFGGLLPKNERTPIGTNVTSSSGINGLALQLCMLLLAYFIGEKFFVGLTPYISFFARVPSINYGLFGGLFLFIVMRKLKIDGWVDRESVNSIQGCALEYLIFALLATTNLKFLISNIVPIIIISVIMMGLTWVQQYYMCKRYCKVDWFEKFLLLFGQCTGVMPAGLLLVREVDPDNKSEAVAVDGIYAGTFGLFTNSYVAICIPMMCTGGIWPTFFIFGILAMVVLFIGLKMLGRAR